MAAHSHAAGISDKHRHEHPHAAAGSEEPRAPTQPSESVLIDVGEHAGALVLRADVDRSGLEVEIHPVDEPSRRTHVWVLPRKGHDGATIHAAVFPSLAPGDYAVLEPDGTSAFTVAVPANQVTSAAWG